MKHSQKYNTVLSLYKSKFWNLKQTKNAVIMKWITPEEFYEITGQEYEEA